MRPELLRDPAALDRAARGLDDLADGLPGTVDGPAGDRAVRLRRVADELNSLAAAARRAAATARTADDDTVAVLRAADRHVPAPPGAGTC
ncbi:MULTISPECIES: hypothetical protein [Pseudonocardia]|uniref:hypothetical protein n=1 Tax=Pseudonocardia TaxID=1847 RepID=UPI001AD68A3B|nr:MULTISPECIES: hypothetical protein [Pseudonocardia]MBO4239299.1 hypothetical protein [Pseudonocardia alni]